MESYDKSLEANTLRGYYFTYLLQIDLHYLASATKSPESNLTPKFVILAYIKAWAIQIVFNSPELSVLYVSINVVNPFGKDRTYIKKAAN